MSEHEHQWVPQYDTDGKTVMGYRCECGAYRAG